MSRTKRITLFEFKLLVQGAQQSHASKHEPIPQIEESQLNKVDSFLKTPFQTFDKKDLYRGFLAKASILFYLINKGHALTNGNKRMACLTLGYFCVINKKQLTIPPNDFHNLATIVTNSDPNNMEQVIKIIEQTLSPYIN